MQAAFESLKEIEKQLQNINESAKPTVLQQFVAILGGFGNSALVAASEGLTFAENIKEQQSALEAQKSALLGVIKENSNYVNVVTGSNAATEKGIDLSKKDAAAKREQKDAFDQYIESLNKAEAAKKKSLEVRTAMGVGPLDQLPQAPGAVLPEAGQTSIGAMVEGLTAMTDLTMAAGDGFTKLTNTISTGGTIMEQMGYAMAAAFEQAGASGEASFGKMALAAVGAAAKIIRTNIQIAVTQAALSALRSIPFPFNIAAAAAAGALASGLFNKLISSIGIPALAEGGVISKPTTALMGEYPGARTNPEIVTPENKMRDVFKGVMRRFSSMNGGVLTTRISNRDILFILEQAQYDSRRTRGR